jgi:hypothetical protein
MTKMPRRFFALFALLLFLPFAFPRVASAANNPVPLINDPLVPSAVAPGGADFTLTVNGSNFVAASVVKLNGAALTTTFVNSSQLTATVPNTLIATAGSASITVTNPAPGGGTSLPAYLRIATPVSTPSFVSYLQAVNFSGAPGIYSPVTGDFNSDGKLDMAFLGQDVSSGTSIYSVCIALGNGNGSFQPAVCQQAASSRYFSGLVAGDFNGDGKLDLAVANDPNPVGIGNGFISLFLGNGDGTLRSPINSSPSNSQFALAAGDFNHDGNLDIAVTNINGLTNSAFVAVLLGNGDGTFQAPVNYASGISPDTVTVGDFNRDGILDLVISQSTVQSGGITITTIVYFLAGNGDGTFQSPQTAQTTTSNNFDQPIAAADFNGDGKLDLVTFTNSILLGNGDGTFQPEVAGPSFGACRSGQAIDDINADSKLDLGLCAGNASNTSMVGLALGNGTGTFATPINLPMPIYVVYPSAIMSGDFNGDGRVDFVTGMTYLGSGSPTSLLVFLQGEYPVVDPSVPLLSFPPQAVGVVSGPQPVTLTNNSTVAVTLSGFSFSGANAAYFGQTNNCGSTIAGGSSCQVNVTFNPAVAGNAVASMNIASSAVNNPATIALAGSTLGPAATFSPTSVTFPSQYVGTSGTGTLNITNVTAAPSDFATLNACGSSLAVGASCAIGVFFDPTAGGTRTGTLTITDNAGDPQTVPLSGTGKDFSMTPGSASSATISAGQAANYSISLAPAGGFAQSVALTCSGGPVGSNCSVSPGSVSLSGSAPQSVKVTVTTPAAASIPSMVTWPTDRKFSTPLVVALVRTSLFLAAVGLFGTLIRRRQHRLRWAPAFAVALIVTACLALSSCGGGSNGGGGGGTSPESGTYTVTVSGNFATGATNITHNTKLTLVVQ